MTDAAIPDVPHPERPYRFTHTVKFASGYRGLLVAWGAKCQECSPRRTYLQGGAPLCREHLSPLCIHGAAACGRCGPIPAGARVQASKK